MPYIDTHLHLIWRDRFGYGWTDSIPPLATGDFTPADARALTGGRVSGALFMEVGVDDADYQAEARFVAGLVRDGTLLGQIASCRPETDAGFADWLDECAGLGVVGYRRILHVMDDALSQGAGFRANIRQIGVRGKVFDICMLARQLPLAGALARACPGTVFVLDHCGVPDVAGGDMTAWSTGIKALAAIDNIAAVKMSGIAAYAAAETASLATLSPWLDTVLEAFGPGRIVWGSDWPVVNLGGGVAGWLDISDAWLAARLSEAEADQVRHGNARAIWRLG